MKRNTSINPGFIALSVMVILWAPAGDFKTQSWSAYKNWTEPPVPRTSVNPQKESRTVLLVSKRNKRVDTKYN